MKTQPRPTQTQRHKDKAIHAHTLTLHHPSCVSQTAVRSQLHAHLPSPGHSNLQFLAVAALTAGTCNDLFFMLLPLVDNFFHAQCTVMLSARLPLYIPAVYIAFAVWPALGATALALRFSAVGGGASCRGTCD